MLFGIKHFKMNLLSESGGDGGSSAPSTEATSTDNGAPAFTPPTWATGLNVDQEILKAPMFTSIKSMDDVVKGYYNAQKMIGADKIVVPGKNSSSDDWRNYYIKAGLPASFDEYKVELPSTFDNQDFNNEFLKTAYELNVKPDQLQKLTQMFEQSNDKIVESYEEQQAQLIAETAKELKQEWGQGYEKQIARANRVIKHFGGDDMHQAVLNSDLANNKEFLKLMAKIGDKMVGEDSFNYETTSTFGMTKDEARSKMNSIFGDMNSPYFNRDHAQHQEYLDKMLKYQEVLSER